MLPLSLNLSKLHLAGGPLSSYLLYISQERWGCWIWGSTLKEAAIEKCLSMATHTQEEQLRYNNFPREKSPTNDQQQEFLIFRETFAKENIVCRRAGGG